MQVAQNSGGTVGLRPNPVDKVRLPRPKRGKPHAMPYITLDQFNMLVELIAEPYATMVYVAVWTGLRVSELIGLRWGDIRTERNTITIDENMVRQAIAGREAGTASKR